MSKYKSSKCIYCGKNIKRHDEKRVIVQVSDKVKKQAHLSCFHSSQPQKGVER